MTKILLIRHGYVEGIRPERFRGRANLPLTGRGKARSVAERIASGWRATAIYTSHLSRCVETASAIAKACRLEAQTLNELVDIDYGAWRSCSYAALKQADPNLYSGWFFTLHLVRCPNGESLQDLVARAPDALRFVLNRHPGESVILVGTGRYYYNSTARNETHHLDRATT